MILAAFGLFALAVPAEAQMRGNHGGGMRNGGGFHRGDFDRGHFRFHNGGRFNVYFGGFGYPFYYGPYWGYPYYYVYGYPYGWGYPAGAYYSYDPNGVYEGRMANPPQRTNGSGKDVSMAVQVQRGLAAAGYYRGAIDGVIGEGTRRAIRNYERANGLAVDGRIDNQLLASMGLG